MKHNQSGFNNFKSFGERIQMFSDKPITLVYGANSVGKSSFLHAQLYKEYLLRSRSMEFERSDFAGDELALGGFDEFVHKKDTSNKISFRKVVTNPKDLDMILGNGFYKIKEFEKEGVIKEALSLDSAEFVRRLNNYKLKEGEWLFTDSSREHFKKFKAVIKPLRNMLGEEGFIDYFDNSKDLNKAFQAMFGLFSACNERRHSKNIGFEDFKSAMKSKTYLHERLTSKDGEAFDELDGVLIFVIGYSEYLLSPTVSGGLLVNLFGKGKGDPGEFFDYFKNALIHLDRLNEINSITYDFRYGRNLDGNSNDAVDSIDITLSINDSVIINAQLMKNREEVKAELTDAGEIFFKNLYDDESNEGVLKDSTYNIQFHDWYSNLAKKIIDNLQIPSVNKFVWNIFTVSLDSDDNQVHPVNSYAELFIEHLIKKVHQNNFEESSRTIQYFGPLRFYPQREDLTITQEENDWGNFLQENSSIDYFVKNYYRNLNYWVFKRSPVLAAVLKTVKNVFSRGFWVLVLRETSVADSINFFRKAENKRSYGMANSARKLWKYLIASKDLQQEINYWLLDSKKLKSTYELQIEEVIDKSWLRKMLFLKEKKYKSLTFFDKRSGISVTPREMGLGISQFLPILLASKALKNSSQFVEQPELHLHPALQCEVADEFIRSMNTQNNKFFIETHSEHLLLRVMKRMRHSSEGLLKKGDDLYLTPDDVCLLYVDNNSEFTYLNELELDKDGTLLDPWPNGFFEEGLNERFS